MQRRIHRQVLAHHRVGVELDRRQAPGAGLGLDEANQPAPDALETGVDFTDDYRGVRVLSAYGLFSLDGFDWAVMAEIDREEVLQAVADLRLSIPILGIVFYALSLISLWLLDPGGWTFADMGSLDAGDLPPA